MTDPAAHINARLRRCTPTGDCLSASKAAYQPQEEVDSHSIIKQPRLAERLLQEEGDLLQQEIGTLEPHACLFFTGPNYDAQLHNRFPDLRMEPVAGYEQRELARLFHPRLPERSFRAYHPGYLSRGGKWDHIAALQRAVMGD